MKIDFQTHIVTPEFLKVLSKRKNFPRATTEGTRNFVFYADGVGYPVIRKMFDLEKRIEDMDAAGVDIQCLSLSVPGTDPLEPELGLSLSRNVNDSIAEMVEKYPERFVGLANLPLQNVDGAIEELDRAINDLGMKGVMIYSNVAGKPLDSPELWKFYKKAAKLDVPIFIHPTLPVMAEALRGYQLIPVVGFLFDTTLAMLRIIFSGVLEKYPSLKFVLPHVGSTIPYLLGRIDYESGRLPGGRGSISKTPSEYFKLVYIDTVSLHLPAMKCAYETLGIDRIVFGSDYPFWNVQSQIELIEKWDISEDEKRKIYAENAAKLLGLDG
ncbi:MAG: amidohydrolase family protein [Candidatus Hadarchaeum sp.]